jgi:2-oxoglutarate ferredoxin oxidoreductase subunit alpha
MKELVKGTIAVARGAIDAGCRFYFGYPITPQNEIPEYLSRELPRVGGVFIQAESEIASINMLMGAAATGARAMTSSSGPGISLKQEGISYMAGSEIPGVIVNISRCGPGLGGISPSQGDYFQATRGGGHGDYRVIVLAPSSVSEMYYLTIKAFELADKYRNPALLLADAALGQMKESVELIPPEIKKFEKDWVLTGAKGRKPRVLKSLYLGELELEKRIWRIHEKYERMKREDVMVEEFMIEDAEIITVAFGFAARVVKSACVSLREKGYRVGMIRPITLFPFPEESIKKASEKCKKFLVVEMNTGQMVEDVVMFNKYGKEVYFYGRAPGFGSLPYPEEIEVVLRYLSGEKIHFEPIHTLSFRRIT